MHLRNLHQINARNICVTENLQSTCPGFLTEESYIGVGTIFKA